jgi:hypothetical protein
MSHDLTGYVLLRAVYILMQILLDDGRTTARRDGIIAIYGRTTARRDVITPVLKVYSTNFGPDNTIMHPHVHYHVKPTILINLLNFKSDYSILGRASYEPHTA